MNKTYRPDLRILEVPHAARGVDVPREDAHDLVAGRGDEDDGAAVEVELGRVVARGLGVEEGAWMDKKKNFGFGFYH